MIFYHATDAEFTEFDFSLLGQYTRQNTDSHEASVMAELGVWANSQPLSKRTIQEIDMTLDITLSNPLEISFDDLWAVASSFDSGEDLRNAWIAEGYDGLLVDDSEFGGISCVAFSPDQITIII